MSDIEIDTLAAEVREGSVRALARGLSWLEAGGTRAEALMERVYAQSGRAHVVGVTGAAGSGKSTLVRALAAAARERGRLVGIIAVDPSSPFSGGAILGDRIRMNDLSLDPGVFIRSMATRGALGGLCRAAADAVDLMDAAGRSVVFVETVGVGQDEVDIMRVASTVVVVSVPGLGDDVQTLKAGILEVADVHVVNKADRDGADRTIAELRAMLSLAHAVQPASAGDVVAANHWTPPVLPVVATSGEGTEALMDALDAHADHLKTSGELARRRRRMVEARVLGIAQELVAGVLAVQGGNASGREAMLDGVVRREMTPHAAARRLVVRTADHIERTPDV